MTHIKQNKEPATLSATPAPGITPFSEMSAQFGRHNLGDISVNRKGGASMTEGALAFANTTPDLRTTAHEVAHVVQQRQGVES